MGKDEIQLKNWNKALLELTAIKLIPIIINNKELLNVKKAAFEYFDSNSGDFLQVQVTVTRDSSLFLDDHQIEELTEYKG